MDATFIARFWERVDRNGEPPEHCPELGPCWLWTHRRHDFGYGMIRCRALSKRHLYAHRVSWELAHGPPGALFVLHRCDNPQCVRPSHLFLGDQGDNVRDCVSKGRSGDARNFGAANGRTVLSATDVARIREAHAGGASYRRLAREFGVTFAHIGRIVRRQQRTHHSDSDV